MAANEDFSRDSILLTALTYALSDLVRPRVLNLVLHHHVEYVLEALSPTDEALAEQVRLMAGHMLQRVAVDAEHNARRDSARWGSFLSDPP